MNAVWATWGSREPLPVGWRAILAAGVGVLLLAAPWTDAAGGMDFAARVLVLAVLASGQELVTGRGGTWTFTAGLYAALGGLMVAIACGRWGAGPPAIVIGLLAALVTGAAIDAALAALTWRAGRWVFAFGSLTVAIVLPLLGAAWEGLQGGHVVPIAWPAGGSRIAYAAGVVVAVALWVVMLRVANSPFGRVLPALRDNRVLAETLGYPPARYRALSTLMAALTAVLAGAALALWQQASLPLVAGSLDLTLQVLLVGMVGGFGTLWAAPVGAVVVLAAWRWLPALLLVGAGRVPDVPWLAATLSDPASQRWVMAGLVAVLGWAAGGLMARTAPRLPTDDAASSLPASA